MIEGFRYGFLNHFRPTPLMPNQVYRFDPDTGSIRVVADGFDRCNGIAFAPDGKTAFVYAFRARLSFPRRLTPDNQD